MRLATLKKRAEFQRVRGGGRFSHDAFVLEGKRRPATSPEKRPRFGFTITKKVGNAVTRNRIRRRMKAALGELVAADADASFDYVLVGRGAAKVCSFETLKAGLSKAFERVNSSSKAAK